MAKPLLFNQAGKRRVRPHATFAEAFALEEANDLHAAVEAYQDNIAGPQRTPESAINLGTILLNNRQYADALACYRMACEIDPTYAPGFFQAANVYEELGDRATATRFYKQAIALDRDYADAHYNLASLLDWEVIQNSLFADKDSAIFHWLEYLRLEKDSPWANHAKNRLKNLCGLSVIERPAPVESAPAGLRVTFADSVPEDLPPVLDCTIAELWTGFGGPVPDFYAQIDDLRAEQAKNKLDAKALRREAKAVNPG